MMAVGFFEGSKGQTPESVRLRQQAAAALVFGEQPRSVGQGIGLVGQALQARFLADRADQDNAAQQTQIRPGDAGPGIIRGGAPVPNAPAGIDPRLAHSLLFGGFGSPGQRGRGMMPGGLFQLGSTGFFGAG